MFYSLATMRIRQIGLPDRHRMGRLGTISLLCMIMTVLGAIRVVVVSMTVMVIESASLEEESHVDRNATEIIEPVVQPEGKEEVPAKAKDGGMSSPTTFNNDNVESRQGQTYFFGCDLHRRCRL